MPTIDVSDIVLDPDLAQTFTILRSTGVFGMGGYQSVTTTLTLSGTITVASEKHLRMVPEGDRPTGAMAIYSAQRIYVTHQAGANQTQGLSDVLVWRGQNFRVIAVKEWSDYGIWIAVAERLGGQ